MSARYRSSDVQFLTEHIRHHHSVEIVGMRRVGINNFLRHFFQQHQFGQTDRQMYIFIDLNNLVEREPFPFWQLTLKRISDAVRDLVADQSLRREITQIFESAIQYQNLQMTYDGVRESLSAVVRNDIEPVIFFNRFDRVVNMMTESFIDNIRGLYDAAGIRLSCVFTSYRPLSDFYGKKLPFDQFHTHYLTPLSQTDAEAHIVEYEQKYHVKFDTAARREIQMLSGGHVQYMRFIMDILAESPEGTRDLQTRAIRDERITLLSEEVWDSLKPEEQAALIHGVDTSVKTVSEYITKTHMVHNGTLFSPLFAKFVSGKNERTKHNGHSTDFTRKELALFSLLKEHVGAVCERDAIIERVWPESAEDGISDWSIDKLMERLRDKIKTQSLPYQVVTVRTRGYKLIEL